jgi:glutathione S-transferase
MAEKGIDFERHQVTIFKGEHKTDDYRKISPFSRLPALELDDGTIILESVSICRYLEALNPEPNLLGTTPVESALIDMWSRKMELELMSPMAMAYRHTNPDMAGLEKQFTEFGESQRQAANNRVRILNDELADKEYIAGDRYTLADITAQCALEFFPRVSQFELKDEYAHLNRWRAAVKARPSTKASLQT